MYEMMRSKPTHTHTHTVMSLACVSGSEHRSSPCHVAGVMW